MRRFSIRWSLFVLFALASGACSENPTSPASAIDDLEPIELVLESMERDDARPLADAHDVPTLQRLLHEAIVRVRADEGREAALRAIAPLRDLLARARTAREAGNYALARRLLREANLVAARIVVRVLGTQVVVRLDEQITAQVATLQARLAAGESTHPLQLERLITRVGEHQSRTARLIEAGAYPAALLHAAHAMDLVRHASVFF